jgi:hypothetical protein
MRKRVGKAELNQTDPQAGEVNLSFNDMLVCAFACLWTGAGVLSPGKLT